MYQASERELTVIQVVATCIALSITVVVFAVALVVVVTRYIG